MGGTIENYFLSSHLHVGQLLLHGNRNMGIYINRGNSSFAKARRDEYIDKSMLVSYINSTIGTNRNLTCVSRARRFGKSMAAQMLYAYYDKSCDSRKLVEDLKVADPENPYNQSVETAFETHLNKYPTIYIDMTDFTTQYHDCDDIVKILAQKVKMDVLSAYSHTSVGSEQSLMDTLLAIVEETGEPFILILDEWDALCREASAKPQLMIDYVNFLRNLFKGGNSDRVFAAVYMTGILPIKQQGTQSALNNFIPYTMTNPGILADCFGFTKEEVRTLCQKYDMPYDEMERWYDGYTMGNVGHIFNPTSVMLALRMRQFDNYWSQTSSFESIRDYISLDFDGVKQSIEHLLMGMEERVKVFNYGNDVNRLSSKDELFTLLIHYGYFAYDNNKQTVRIPNQEVREELLQAVRTGKRPELVKLIQESDRLLAATLAMREDYVAEALDRFHSQYVTPLFYNNEQALRGLVRYAYIGAMGDFVPMEELPSGKGFVDIAFIPSRPSGQPVLLIELKYNEAVDTAISQIKERRYPEKLLPFADNLLLVAISYDKETKRHACKIAPCTE